jgi:hypothetical protein
VTTLWPSACLATGSDEVRPRSFRLDSRPLAPRDAEALALSRVCPVVRLLCGSAVAAGERACVWRTGGARPGARRDSLSFSRGHQTHGVVAACVRERSRRAAAGASTSWLVCGAGGSVAAGAGPQTSGSSGASSNLLTAMRLLVVVHLATLALDDREAAFVAMPQMARQNAAGSGTANFPRAR